MGRSTEPQESPPAIAENQLRVLLRVFANLGGQPTHPFGVRRDLRRTVVNRRTMNLPQCIGNAIGERRRGRLRTFPIDTRVYHYAERKQVRAVVRVNGRRNREAQLRPEPGHEVRLTPKRVRLGLTATDAHDFAASTAEHERAKTFGNCSWFGDSAAFGQPAHLRSAELRGHCIHERRYQRPKGLAKQPGKRETER